MKKVFYCWDLKSQRSKLDVKLVIIVLLVNCTSCSRSVKMWCRTFETSVFYAVFFWGSDSQRKWSRPRFLGQKYPLVQNKGHFEVNCIAVQNLGKFRCNSWIQSVSLCSMSTAHVIEMLLPLYITVTVTYAVTKSITL